MLLLRLLLKLLGHAKTAGVVDDGAALAAKPVVAVVVVAALASKTIIVAEVGIAVGLATNVGVDAAPSCANVSTLHLAKNPPCV